MLTALFTFLAGPAFGAIVGIFAGYFNRRLDLELKKFEIEARKLDRAHEAAMREVDIRLAQAEADGKARVAIIEGSATIETAINAARAAAFEADKGPPDNIDKLRRAMRPLLTLLLTVGAMGVNVFLLWRLSAVWGDLLPAERNQMVMGGVVWVMSQASTAIGFWFVSRPAEFGK